MNTIHKTGHFFKKNKDIATFCLFVIMGLIVFGNMLFNQYVWDDISYIVQNLDVHTISISKSFGPSYFNEPNVGYYRPLAALYFSIVYEIFQNTPFVFHLLQLLLHITNSFLVYILFKRFFSKNISLFLSLVFLVHPIQVESVSYIAQTIDPLFFLFGMSGLLLSLKKNPGIVRLLIITILLVLSVLSKETGILFIFIVLLFHYLYEKASVIKYFIISIVSMLLYLIIRFAVGHVYFIKITEDTPIGNLPFAERLINLPIIFFYYLKTFFFPLQLVIDQKWVITNPTIVNFYFPLAIDLLFILFLVIIGRELYKFERKFIGLYLLFILWFVSGIGMHMQIFPLDMTVADRWMYFPFVGFLGIIGTCIVYVNTYGRFKKIGFILAVSILILFSLRTIIRNTNWQNSITLDLHDSKILDSSDLENNLGVDYESIKKYPIALKHFTKSVSMQPTELNTENTAIVYEEIGDMKNASRYYDFSTELHAQNLLVSNNPQDANDFIENAVVAYPNDWLLWKYLAIAGLELKNNHEANLAAKQANHLNPKDSDSKHILANQPFNIILAGNMYTY